MASLAVVAHHIAQQTQGTASADQTAGPLLSWMGSWGVTVFFVLSGFCIHGSMLRTMHDNRIVPQWKDYFIRRARRILPGYLAALVISVILGCIADSALITRARWLDLWTHLTFTSGFSRDTALRVNSVLWTIVVEMHFYLVYPLFIWLRNRLDIVRLTFVLLAISVCIKLGGRLWLDEAGRWTWHHSFLNLWWIWALGALLAERHVKRPHATDDSSPTLLMFAASLAIGCFDSRNIPLLGQVVESYGLPVMAALIVATFVRSPLSVLSSKPLTGLGRVSYSMYLLHPVALWLVVQGMPAATPAISMFTMSALAWLLAQAGYQCIERPFLRK